MLPRDAQTVCRRADVLDGPWCPRLSAKQDAQAMIPGIVACVMARKYLQKAVPSGEGRGPRSEA